MTCLRREKADISRRRTVLSPLVIPLTPRTARAYTNRTTAQFSARLGRCIIFVSSNIISGAILSAPPNSLATARSNMAFAIRKQK